MTPTPKHRRVGNYTRERLFGDPLPPAVDFSGLLPPDPAQVALRLAIEHINHMAAWITKTNASDVPLRGYSFEALGEDMPTIKAGLKS